MGIWKPSREIAIPYDSVQKDLYRGRNPTCIYYNYRWPDHLWRGRGKHGEFPLVVARKYYTELGFTVWASEPELDSTNGWIGFILLSFPGKRRVNHPAYLRMANRFGTKVVDNLNRRVDSIKRQQSHNVGGGDPDLFVFNEGNSREEFFVEVKDKGDRLNEKQRLVFWEIERLCEVRIARLIPNRLKMPESRG